MSATKRGKAPEARKATVVCAILVLVLAAQFGAHPAAAFAQAVGNESEISRFRVYFPMYLVSDAYLYPVEYYVPKIDSVESTAIEALESLIEGLPGGTGYRFIKIPETTEVLGLTIANGLCTADFSADILQANVGSGAEAALLNAIVATLAQFQTVDKVSILIDGQVAETLAGHVDISGPLEPNYDKVFRGFEDSSQHWAGGSIMVLQAMDIMVGYPEDWTSRPEEQLTRAEFLKLVVETLELPLAPDQAVPFSDMGTHWSLSHIQRALAAGVISASDYGETFNPNGVIPREEMAFILAPAREAYSEAHPDIVYPPPAEVPTFTDASEVEARYLDTVVECAELGLLTGYPSGEFGPKRGLTRGEAATVLARLMGMAGAGTQVVVSTPRPGHAWDEGRFVVLGSSAAFEGTVDFRFLGPNREVYYWNYTTSTLGMAFGAVGISVDTSLFEGEPTLLEVYLVSMEDGSDFRLTGVPIEAK